MGRFYQTAKPTFVDDIIYEAPYELMLNALKTQDEAFAKSKEGLGDFKEADLLSYVDKDKGQRDQLLSQHYGAADEISQKMAANPALFRQYAGDINKARQAFDRDLKSGGLFEMDRTAKRRDALMKELKDRKDLNEDSRKEAIAKIDREYQGWGINEYSDNIHVYEKVDPVAYVEHLKNTFTPDVLGATTTKPQGNGYFRMQGDTEKWVSEDKVRSSIKGDPQFENWEKEQRQFLERAAENPNNPLVNSQEEVEIELSRRKEDFITSSVNKLIYKQEDKQDIQSADGTWMGKAQLAWDKHKYNQQREDEINGYEQVVEGRYEGLDDATIDQIYPPGTNGVSGEKRAELKKENEALFNGNSELTKRGIDRDQFRELMKTPEGRTKVKIITGMSAEKLARQANMEETRAYKYEDIKSDLDDGQNARENKKMAGAVVESFNSMSQDTPLKYKIVSSDGRIIESGESSLGQLKADKRNIVPGRTIATKVSELVPMTKGGNSGYKGHDGEVVMIKEGGKSRAATKEEVTRMGTGVKKSVDAVAFNDRTFLLDVKPNEVSQSEKVEHRGGGNNAPIIKTNYNAHSSVLIDGKLHTIVIEKDFNIQPTQIIKKK